jgi:hypothetical protein
VIRLDQYIAHFCVGWSTYKDKTPTTREPFPQVVIYDDLVLCHDFGRTEDNIKRYVLIIILHIKIQLNEYIYKVLNLMVCLIM